MESDDPRSGVDWLPIAKFVVFFLGGSIAARLYDRSAWGAFAVATICFAAVWWRLRTIEERRQD